MTENPRVGGSIPPLATIFSKSSAAALRCKCRKHHGADNGTGDALLAEAKPEQIFISDGDHARAIDRQTAFGFGQPH